MPHPVHGPRTEPKGHVLDIHDVEAMVGAMIAAARDDIRHEARAGVQCRWDGSSVRHCDRGGHVCWDCGKPIWDCARNFLNGLATALEDYPAGEMHRLLDAADVARTRWDAPAPE